MTYTPNIPQATDDPSQSQSLILQNFQQLDTQYGSSGDHVQWSAVSANGKHKKTTWIDQTAAVPTAGLNELVAYGITQSGVTMPYYKRDNLSTVYPLSPIKSYATFLRGANGPLVPQDSFNVTSITQVSGSQWTVVMANACRTANYGILFVGADNGFRYGFINTNTTTFTLNANGSIPLNTRLNFIVLET